MEEYPFAYLDQSDLHDLKALETRLTGKHGKQIILLAYEQNGDEGGIASLTALQDGADPEDYGVVQAFQETGYDI